MELKLGDFNKKSEQEINMMPPLVWAYIGDCVYELYIRSYLVNKTNFKPHKLHVEATKYVKASAQAKIVHTIKDKLQENELDIIRRGRNAENHHVAKNATVIDYAYSTGFEALIGYLYLTQKSDRLNEILKQCIAIIEE